MVKQYISAVLEDLIGEYVVNISKDKIKLAALKGKIKLENVELDGDFIGSHILGAVGLQGFGVLSCSAKTLQIIVPWANLDEPTMMEIHGMHLLCVPLLPTTSTRIYCGAWGSSHSSRVRCSLRTRAKRSALARFERNFFAGRISGEGPNLECQSINDNTLDYHGRGQRWSVIDDADGNLEEENDVFFDLQDNDHVRSSVSSSTSREGANLDSRNKSLRSSPTKTTKEGRLPALKKKLTNKIYENLVSSVKDIHIRVEVPEGGLNFDSPKQCVDTQVPPSELEISDRKAFAFGLTLNGLTVRNIPSRSAQSAPLIFPGKGDDDEDERTSKQIEIKDLSVYWDDDAPFLISECDLLKGLFSMESSRYLSQIAIAMQELATNRNVSGDTASSLSKTDRAESKSSLLESLTKEEHDYICTNFSQIMITTFIDRVTENSFYSMEILPSLLDLSISSQQNRQYQRLRDAVLSQQRFDTMLQKRPSNPPSNDPRGWWKYIISCVKHKPTSRSWKDVVEIIHCREKYIDLVMKNLSSDGGNSGYHGGLSFQERNSLLAIEDFLPIETLLSFHLLALRRVFTSRCGTTSNTRKTRHATSNPRQGSMSSLSRLWKSLTRSTTPWYALEEELPFYPLGDSCINRNAPNSEKNRRDSSCSVIETTFQLNQFQLRVCLLERLNKTPIIAIEIDFKGLAHNLDSIFRVNLDILRCEVVDIAISEMTTGGKVLAIETIQDKMKFQHVGRRDRSEDFVFSYESVEYVTSSTDGLQIPLLPSSPSSNHNICVPPEGVVCRLTAIASENEVSMSLSCNPVTIVWNKSSADTVADFFLSSTIEIQSQFLSRLQRAATPLAHRAQLALLYPSSLSVRVNFFTLKVWIPVSMHMTDGALLLEMGELDASLSKPEQSLEWNWNARAIDIKLNFARGLSTDAFDKDINDTPQIDAVSNCLGDEMTILNPFQISMSGKSGQNNSNPSPPNLHFPVDSHAPIGGVSGVISVDVGSIRLNLVDADELAKAIGRFYASELVRMKTKASDQIDAVDLLSIPEESYDGAPSFELNLLVEKVELALECFQNCDMNGRERACHENRTYLIQVNCIKFKKRSKGLKAFSRLSIADAGVQLAEVENVPNFLPRLFKPSKELQHQILAKKISGIEPYSPRYDYDLEDTMVPPQTPKRASEKFTLRTPNDLREKFMPANSEPLCTPEPPSQLIEFVRACHFHDEENHTDEIEFDVMPLIIRITPLSILDFVNTSRRILELIHLASTEIERKVHDGGRKARKKKQKQCLFSSSERTPTYSTPSFNAPRSSDGNTISTDSSFIFRVTFEAASILVGRPASEFCCSRDRRGLSAKPVDYVAQLSTNASIILQSIENADASGSKTLHISMDDFSASINPNFEHSTGLPIIDPFAADFRSVYLTEATPEGSVFVSQDFSFDCEAIICHVTPHDIRVVSSIFRKTIEKLQPTAKVAPYAISFHERGSGIATRIRAEFHSFSFVVMHLFQSHTSGKVNVATVLRPFIEFTSENTKLRLGGCLSALTGELNMNASINFFNPKLTSWEAFVEPFEVTATIDQMPNESLYIVSSHNHINVNLTGTLLSEIARIENSSRTRENVSHCVIENFASSKSLRHVKFVNSTGIALSLEVCASSDLFDSNKDTDGTLDKVIISPGNSIPLKPWLNGFGESESCTLSLSAPHRETINISLKPSILHAGEKAKCLVFIWNPCNIRGEYQVQSVHFEPIVEYVMENQRLRPNIIDIYSIDKGQDLISATAWSPDALFSTAERKSPPLNKTKSLWLPPYLEGDAHEWTDSTCRHHCARESFQLPNNEWIWANDWEIEIVDDLGENDADGWEYSSDFETFSRQRRSYRRGDLCRRRRWTRTRVRKPAFDKVLDNPCPVVWETERCDSGIVILIRSHLTFHNKTSTKLSFFGYSSSFNEDKLIESVPPESHVCVPIELAQFTHIRLGSLKGSKMTAGSSKNSIYDYFVTDRLMILPSGISTARVIRTSIDCDQTDSNGLSSLKRLHFLIRIVSKNGLCDVYIEPILRILNLLPCQLLCQLGETQNASNGRKIVPTDEVEIPVGKEAKCISVDCTLKPHMSVRLPGTRWASWTRIVNREQNSFTWRPTEEEELSLFELSQDDPNRGNEYRTILHLDNKCAGGNSIKIVMSVETGHIPIIRVYAQYWILDKSGLGLKFTDGFIDLIGNTPDASTTRKSCSNRNDINNNDLKLDICRQGYEWSLGINGMTLFFSRKERISLSIEYETGANRTTSKWSPLLDVSRVMPTKSVVSVDEVNGTKRFELAYNVTLCSSIFSRTRVITFYPRYQIVNLLSASLIVAQECALGSDTHIPPQSWVPFHWEKSTFPTKIRLKFDERENASAHKWSKGCIHLDKIGITALRMPSTNNKPIVVQAETRLATKKQDCAVMVVIWSSIEKSNPLYLMKNNSPFTIFCFQPTNKTQNDGSPESSEFPELFDKLFNFECGQGLKFVENDDSDTKEYIWAVAPGESIGFGWDDPEVAHVLRWTCLNASNFLLYGKNHSVNYVEVDTIGHTSSVELRDFSVSSSGMEQQLICEIKADKSTKVILFDLKPTKLNDSGVPKSPFSYDTEVAAVSFQVNLPGLTASIIDNVSDSRAGREILLVTSNGWSVNFSQTREAYHEFEFKLSSFQIDNFIHATEHPVLLHSPLVTEPFLHLSLVCRLQDNKDTYDISYIALRILEIDICFDRKTADTMAEFVYPLHEARENQTNESWVQELTSKMSSKYSKSNRRAPRDLEKFVHSANVGRVYIEHLHLHPIRLSFTFTQEWSRRNQETEGLILFQIIRGMASISEAPLTFTSFVVSHAFESPTSLMGIISAHYSSQLMSQLLSIIGSLAILKAPADFLTNIGSGVFSFFYEPINGLVKGPKEFLQGLEHGTQNLARGVFVGFVRGAANVTDLVTHNLAGLTDDFFIDERNAYQKMILYGGGTSAANKSIQDSLSIAGVCVARGFRSGASGIIEQPSMYASRYGAIGLVKGIGKALVGAVVKPVVGVADGAVVLMNHVSDATSDKEVVLKIPKRLRRALSAVSSGTRVKLSPYDEISAKAQKIVTGGETVDDTYLGHVHTATTLFIASSQCLWAIDNTSREPWCIGWAGISNFGFVDGKYMRIDVFSNEGIHSNIYEMTSTELADLFGLLSMQVKKMGNCSQIGLGFDAPDGSGSSSAKTSNHIPGIQSIQRRHTFGSINKPLKMTTTGITNENELINRCRTRVKELGSSTNDFFRRLDEESWLLVNSWGQYFTGLSSRRCVAVGIINGTLEPIQIKSANLVEGGSRCYFIPSSEYDDIDNILHPGGAILFFGSGAVPSLLQSGNVAISIESNAFLFDLTDQISQSATAYTRPGLRAGFLEKSFDKSGWWAKYWILISKDPTNNC